VLKPVRVADGDHQLAGEQRPRIAEVGRDQVRRRDPDHGDVGVGVVTDKICVELASVRKRDTDARRAIDNMTVREDETVGREHEPGTTAGSRSATIVVRASRAAVNIDADDGWGHDLDRVCDRAGVGIQ
jgi:hypothetical protein